MKRRSFHTACHSHKTWRRRSPWSSNTLVEGRLVIRTYDDKDGNKRKATEIVIDNMQMLGSRPAGEDGGYSNGGGYSGSSRSAASSGSSSGDYFDDELDDEQPF